MSSRKYFPLSEIFVTKKYDQFSNWFHETEGFALRSERCYDDYEMHKNIGPFKNFQRWLEAAFLAGRMENTYQITVEEDQHGLYIQLPKELLAQTGWQTGTVLEWHDNKDGSWTIKAKQ